MRGGMRGDWFVGKTCVYVCACMCMWRRLAGFWGAEGAVELGVFVLVICSLWLTYLVRHDVVRLILVRPGTPRPDGRHASFRSL